MWVCVCELCVCVYMYIALLFSKLQLTMYMYTVHSSLLIVQYDSFMHCLHGYSACEKVPWQQALHRGSIIARFPWLHAHVVSLHSKPCIEYSLCTSHKGSIQ